MKTSQHTFDYRIVVREDRDTYNYEYWWPVRMQFCWLPTEVQSGEKIWLQNIIKVYVQIGSDQHEWSGWILVSQEHLTMIQLQYPTMDIGELGKFRSDTVV